MQKIEEEKEKEKEKTERANGERIGKESENSHSTRKGSIEMREEDGALEEKGTANGESEKAKSEAVCDDLDELNKSLVRLAKCSIGKKRAEVKIQDIKHQQSIHKDIKQSYSEPAQEDHEKEKEDNTNAEEDQKEIIKETKSCKEREDSPERSKEAQRKLSVESPAGVDGKDDVYVYLCPFPDCDFSTDFQVELFHKKM